MPKHLLAATFVLALLAASTPAPALAGEGHDHGEPAPAAGAAALPRFAAVSESFELVGVLAGRQITLYLDRHADNAPVSDARIELDIGGTRHLARKQGDDAYEVALAEAPKPGVLPIMATVTVGNETDLLAAELDLHEPPHADERAAARLWPMVAGWAGFGLAALLLLLWVAASWRRRWRTSRRSHPVDAGGAA